MISDTVSIILYFFPHATVGNKIKLSTMAYNNKFLLSKHDLRPNKLYEYWSLYVGKIIYLSTILIGV